MLAPLGTNYGAWDDPWCKLGICDALCKACLKYPLPTSLGLEKSDLAEHTVALLVEEDLPPADVFRHGCGVKDWRLECLKKLSLRSGSEPKWFNPRQHNSTCLAVWSSGVIWSWSWRERTELWYRARGDAGRQCWCCEFVIKLVDRHLYVLKIQVQSRLNVPSRTAEGNTRSSESWWFLN